ncbi:hypothetical protein JZX86_25965 [Agrobacterium rosae]|uniref:VOC family protein n=1 Tax=Agrobacterium rosae TaxID=1972867 RepID=UPI0019D3219F|nr:VOC family protein [Agrobacterium rosae]MBN7808779.1 hypothetical protein [Agrobacterium rosae]
MKLHAITFDCEYPKTLATWWSQVLNVPIGGDYGDNVVLLPTDSTPLVLFQKIADLPTQRNRVHADFSTRDLDDETDRLVALGGKVVEKIELSQVRYTKMTDPVGNGFDLVREFELPKQ